MNLKSFRAFVLIMEHGTLARASELMHLSPPAVSRLIRMLEDDLGHPLFERVKKRLIPTQAGEQLYPEALRILGNIDGLPEFLKQTSGGQQPPLRIICHNRAVYGLVVPAMIMTTERHPDARFLLDVQTRKVFSSQIAQDQFHIGIASLPIPGYGIRPEFLCETELSVLIRADNPLASKATLHLRDLANEPYIALTESTHLRHLVDGDLIRTNSTLNIVHEISTSAVAHHLVQAGIGFTITERASIGPSVPDGLKLIPLRPRTMLKMGLFRSNSIGEHPLAEAFINQLRFLAKKFDHQAGKPASSK